MIYDGVLSRLLGIDMAEMEKALRKQFGRKAKAAELNVGRSEEHTSELQSLMRISYAVFCLKKKTDSIQTTLTKTKSSHANERARFNHSKHPDLTTQT